MPPRSATKPLLIFDGDCALCRFWVGRSKRLTADTIDHAPSQKIAERFPHIPREAFAQSVLLVCADGTVASGASAIIESLGRGRLYKSSRLLAAVSESVYHSVARYRGLFFCGACFRKLAQLVSGYVARHGRS